MRLERKGATDALNQRGRNPGSHRHIPLALVIRLRSDANGGIIQLFKQLPTQHSIADGRLLATDDQLAPALCPVAEDPDVFRFLALYLFAG
jgi:hypothetical protein